MSALETSSSMGSRKASKPSPSHVWGPTQSKHVTQLPTQDSGGKRMTGVSGVMTRLQATEQQTWPV
jgi:hypothetical protein